MKQNLEVKILLSFFEILLLNSESSKSVGPRGSIAGLLYLDTEVFIVSCWSSLSVR